MAREDPITGAVSFRLDENRGSHRSNKRTASIEKYPAKQHAQRVAEKLGVDKGLIYLPGSPITFLEDSDQPIPFRQRRYFYYITGVNEAACHATYDIAKDSLTLYITPPDLRDAIYNGRGPTVGEALEQYDIDDCSDVSRLPSYIQAWAILNPEPIYLLHESQKPNADVQKDRYETDSLQKSMDLARVIKDFHEIELIRKANKITAAAHRHILEKISSFKNEREVSGAFIDTCISKGAPNQAYEIIAASGENASTLHYIRNDEPLEGRQLMCLDAGCEYECYASDVTRTFPLSGSWPSKEAKKVYDLVQKMQDACVTRMGPGVRYLDLHLTAHKTAIEGLLELGILHNGSVDEILQAGTSQAFYPHGLGHHVGLEVHDVLYKDLLQPVHGPHASLKAMERSNTSFWHTYRPFHHATMLEDSASPYGAILEENMVLTVEPGIYFSRLALESVYLPSPKHSKYINEAVLKRYLPVGGVRIEDNYLITAKGNENLTLAPKGDDMLRIINGEAVISDDSSYGPIRGRPERHTLVDTKDIKRQVKRRLASMEYAEEIRKIEALTRATVAGNKSDSTLEKPNEIEVGPTKAVQRIVASKKPTRTVPTLPSSPLAESVGTQALDSIQQQRTRSWTRKERNFSPVLPLPVSSPLPQEKTIPVSPPTDTSDMKHFQSSMKDELSEKTSPLIVLGETQHPDLPQPSVVYPSNSSPELEWHDQPTLFHNFTAPNIVQKAPDVPEKPIPYRSNSTSARPLLPPISKLYTAGSSPKDPWGNRLTSKPQARLHRAVRADSNLSRERISAITRQYEDIHYSPVSPIRPYNDTFSLMHMPGAFPPVDSPPVSPIVPRVSLRNRQSMPVLSNVEAIPTRSSTLRVQRPASKLSQRTLAIRPTTSTLSLHGAQRDTNPFRLHETAPMLTRAPAPKPQAIRSHRSVSRHHTALPPPPPPSRYPQVKETYLDFPSRLSLPSFPLPSPRVTTQSHERPPLEPWWLVQAAGELRRKHPQTSFYIRWSAENRSWMISCATCCHDFDFNRYRVGPGQTLDEFENHLWMKHEQERQTPQDLDLDHGLRFTHM